MLDHTAVSIRGLQTAILYAHMHMHPHTWRGDRNWKPVSSQFRYRRGFAVLSTLRQACETPLGFATRWTTLAKQNSDAPLRRETSVRLARSWKNDIDQVWFTSLKNMKHWHIIAINYRFKLVQLEFCPQQLILFLIKKKNSKKKSSLFKRYVVNKLYSVI